MSTTRYVKIDALQPPFDLGVDDSDRAQIVFNVLAEKIPSDTFARELVSLLVAAGCGTFGTTLVAGSKGLLPIKGTVVSIIETGGMKPKRIHNEVLLMYERPTAKIIVHAEKYEDAMAMSRKAYRALVVVKNQAVTVA